MATLPTKVEAFLKEVENFNCPTADQRRQAMELLAETLHYRNARLCHTREELAETARKLKELHVKLLDMNRRLELARKAGLVSRSVH